MAPPSRVVSALSLLTTVLGEADGCLLAVAFLLSEALVLEVPVDRSEDSELVDSLPFVDDPLVLSAFVLAEADADADAGAFDGPSIGVGEVVGLVPVQPVNKKAATANAES